MADCGALCVPIDEYIIGTRSPREAPWVADVLVLEGAMISEHCLHIELAA